MPTLNMAIKISVVIGTYNQKDKLKLTLDSLLKQTLAPELYEIIVVDSSSNDGTPEMMDLFRSWDPHLKYFRVENRGKPFARNFGVDQSRGEIILLTDADMIANPNLVLEHLKAHEKHPDASFEGTTINPDKKPYIKENFKPWQKLKFSYFLTGNLSIRKKAFIDAGRFDEVFAGYGWEDIELGYRLSKMKHPLYYLPYAINYHNHEVSEDDMLARKFDMGRSAAVFLKKHPNMEIRYFLGLNPIAMGIFKQLNKHPNLLKYVTDRSASSPFFKYVLEEFNYRKGLEAEGAN
jgi:glycosyltransferase involved in cell wall biosynthesis